MGAATHIRAIVKHKPGFDPDRGQSFVANPKQTSPDPVGVALGLKYLTNWSCEGQRGSAAT
jgi:hypothetical protein